MKKYFKLLALFIVSGCATAEMVRESNKGGRVLIHGSKSIAAKSGEEKANVLMKQKCPNGFVVVEKGEMSVGQAHVSSALMSINLTEAYLDFECKD
jgi:hypothetical protein